ncbi:alpha/beta hydrolase [Hoyosella sp. YIM 151337]|uniref:alpha/beta hydrolase n=1 Tax=Hoyosella sp. YIM 151337 TaxID=2992742 RepID=UPI002235A9DE|nr:alpha/beta hydrolase [Hoyosella sp. YIM 151337]MCW4355704.1 alpha/beta hydrolase [Hoyosella sp. YIM 151337]
MGAVVDLAKRGLSRVMGATPDAWWSPLARGRTPVDGQLMPARLHVLSALAAPHLAALRAPTKRSRAMVDLLMGLNVAPDALAVSATDLEFAGESTPLHARLYEPVDIRGNGLIVFLHGGGWHVGSVGGYDPLLRFLAAKAGVRVFAFDYRLAPDHPFPAAFDDCLAGYRYAVAQADDWGIDPHAIAIAGDSAGGNLAAAVALELAREDATSESVTPRPVLAALIYPALDADLANYESSDLFDTPLTRAGVDRALNWYLGGVENGADLRFSVLNAEELSLMPPTYIATAGMDVLRDQGEAFAAVLKKTGVKVTAQRFDNLPHGFVSMLPDPVARAAAGDVAAAIGEALRRGLH